MVVFPVLSFSFTNEMTLQVPTSCCLSGSAAPAVNVPHVRAAAIGIDNSAFMALPPVFQARSIYNGFWLAAQLSQSLKSCAGHSAVSGAIHPTIRHRRPVRLTTPRRGHAFEKAQSTEMLRATLKIVPSGPRSCRRSARKPSSEAGPVAQYRTAAVGASACRALRRKPGTNIRFWHFRTCGCRGTMSVRGVERTLSLPFADFRKWTQSGHRAKHGAAHAHFWLAAGHPTTEVARADAKLEKLQQLSRRPRRSRLHCKNKNLPVRCEQLCVVHRS